MAILLIVFVPLGLWGYYQNYLLSSVSEGESPGVLITIEKGSSVRQIMALLDEKGLIHADFRFLVLAKLSGLGTRLQAGEFLVPSGKKPLDILSHLVTAQPVHYSITIPEGFSMDQIGDAFAKEGWCDGGRFKALVRDVSFLEKRGFSGMTSLEGFLFPDTYYLTRNIHGAEQIIALLLARFETVWSDMTADIDNSPDLLKTVTLASIVEKETGAAWERPLIAGVFLNRLRLGMRLQSDPTVVYGIEGFTGRITKNDLRTPTPHNTYVIKGLPAGPICSPGRGAIEAVLHPQKTDKLYFVSKNDGTHYFSKSLREHNRAVQEYQRAKKKVTQKK